MQIGPRIKFDRHTLGNAVKNLSPVAGLLGGPLGFAAAGGLSALGDVARGKKVSVGNALTNATLGSGLNAAKGAIAKHVAGNAATSAIPGAATDTVASGGLALPETPNLVTAATRAVDPRNFAERALDTGGNVLGWAADHPNAAAGALQGVGALATSGAQNRTANAQADLLQKQAEETEYDFQRRKARDAQLAPVWSSLGTAFGNGIAANPYLPPAGG